jgi:hypothetical protein
MRDRFRSKRTLLAHFSFWLLIILVAGLTVIVGVAAAAALGQRGSAANWRLWSDVGQTFGVLSSIIGALTLAVVVTTARAQFWDLRRNAAANLSILHLDLMKMSINEPELAKVWPPPHSDVSSRQNRQYLYANMIYQFHWTALKLDAATDEEVIGSMTYLFTSPVMRDYWEGAREARASLPPSSPEAAFTRRLDEICRAYRDAAPDRTPDAAPASESAAAETPATAAGP